MGFFELTKIKGIFALLKPLVGFLCFSRICLRYLILVNITILAYSPLARAEEGLDTIINTLSGLTCETQGVGDLLRTQFAHTCIPASFSTFAVANLLSPGLYANTLLRVKINDKELFPGACDRKNRVEFNNRKLSFAMCNNVDLALFRGEAVGKSAVAIAKSIITGADPWQDIKDSWNIPKSNYHKMFIDQPEGASGVMFDVGVIPVFPWKVIRENDKLCVATTGFLGWISIGCKYIKEPFPVSIYADFMDVSPSGMGEISRVSSLTRCGNMGSCYKRAYDNSRAAVVMTGPVIECVKEMAAKLMVSNAVCSFDEAKLILGSTARQSSALFQFQKNMHKTVVALLSIYIIFFGFKILLSGDIPSKSELGVFIVKFLFVTYFSIGLNINSEGGDLGRMDGMVQWAFPFLLEGMTQIASWIINASPSELCKYSASDYPNGLEHMSLWDSLDCRISHYLGMDMIQNIIADSAMRQTDFSKFDVFSFPVPPYLYLLIPAVISGNFTLIGLAISYPLLVISIAAFVVNATVVCIISTVILGMLAPIFVPMYLFDYTKMYFESWARLMISFMLQPMVAVLFMTTMMTVYDFGFYGTCKYKATNYKFTGPGLTISMPNAYGAINNDLAGGSRAIRYFTVDNNWGAYSSEEEIRGCQDSLGYILNNPLQFAFNAGEDLANTAMPWLNDPTGMEDKKRFPFLESIIPSSGMFFNMVEVVFEKIKKLVISLLTACFILYLMYNFSGTLAEFAADMTESVSLDNITIKPQKIYQTGMSALNKMKALSGDAMDQVSNSAQQVRDQVGTEDDGEGEEAQDEASSGGGGAQDQMSAGGGGQGGGVQDQMSGGGGMPSGGGGGKPGGGEDLSGAQGLQKKLGQSATGGFNTSEKVKSSVKGEDLSRGNPIESELRSTSKSEKERDEQDKKSGSKKGDDKDDSGDKGQEGGDAKSSVGGSSGGSGSSGISGSSGSGGGIH